MKTLVALFILIVLAYGGPAGGQDLPPDILADQYLLEAATAMKAGDPQAALRAFGKIETLDVKPPLEFLYFYGKLLVENGSALDDVLKGQSLLKQYVLNIEKDSEHYAATLKLLSMAGRKSEEFDAERRAESEQRRQAEAEAEAKRRREAKLKELLPDLNKQMIYVQGGAFRMGCTRNQKPNCYGNEKPVHRVRVRSFEVGKYEVTQEVWEAVMGDNPSRFKGCARCPTESVRWGDVQAFLRKLNKLTGERYRLPTEAEWEYAARGGQQSREYRYVGSNNLDSVAWHKGNSEGKTHTVGQKQPNELGLYDMSGNVWEWVQDCRNDGYDGAPGSGSAWETGDCSWRMIRGGSWYNTPSVLRAASRVGIATGNRYNLLGFRVARTHTP